MDIQLLEGDFKCNEALDLITQMIHLKIKFHENKINKSENEEDVKAREAKIKKLQKCLYEFRNNVGVGSNMVKINAIITIE